MKKFVYKPYTKDDLDTKISSSSGRESLVKEGISVFTPKVGASNKIRILPQTWTEEKDIWCKEIWIHYDVGPDNTAALCLKRNFGKDCPVCEAYNIENDAEIKQKFLPKKRMVAYIIDRSDDKPEPKVWFMPPSQANQIRLQSVDEDTGEVILIDHPYEGFDVTVLTQKGPDGARIKFTYEGVAIARKPSPIHPDPKVVESILDFIVENPIPSLFNIKDYDYLKKLLYGYATKPLDVDKTEELHSEDSEEIVEQVADNDVVIDSNIENKLEDLRRKWRK